MTLGQQPRSKETGLPNSGGFRELINFLKNYEDQNQICLHGFDDPHSYRGYYDELAFEPRKNVTVAKMLREAESAVNETFEGYKGGYFTMTKDTPVWISKYGSTGCALTEFVLSCILQSE